MQIDDQNGILDFRNAADDASEASPSLRSEEARFRDKARSAPWRPAELTIVVPTYRERDNIAELVLRLDETLAGIVWEVIFVDDDSPDMTSAIAKTIAARDGRVLCIRRVG